MKISKLYLSKMITFLLLASVMIVSVGFTNPVNALEEDYTIIDNSNGSYTIVEYGDSYSVDFIDNNVKVNNKYYSKESYNLALEEQFDNANEEKSLIYFLEKFKTVSKPEIHLILEMKPFASYNSKPPTTGYGPYRGPFYRPKFDGLYVTIAAGSVAQVASLFGIAVSATKAWISGFLGGLGVSKAWVSGHEKVWTATHNKCGAAAKDRVQPTLKKDGFYYDAKTPGGSPIYKYRNYWYTDPSGYPGC